MEKRCVRDIDVKEKRVLLRVDFNVPVDNSGNITDDSRIRGAIPTVQYLVDHGARIILSSHFGRPEGQFNQKYSLAPMARQLSVLLKKPIKITPDVIGPEVEKTVNNMKKGDILMLENLRFYAGEEKNDPVFAKSLANLADVYVDDAFGAAHRAHASITGVAKYLPAVGGFLLEREVDYLSSILNKPARPFVAVLGGAKISDKVSLVENIILRVDFLLIGGGMAATFLKSRGIDVGQSIIEAGMVEIAASLLSKVSEYAVKVYLPIDVVIAPEANKEAEANVVPVRKIPDDKMIVDIGPHTLRNFEEVIKKCETIFWNGPMGIFEIDKFAWGTKELMRKIAGIKANKIIGGGSTAGAVAEMGLKHQMTFISTGGGAALEFLSGQSLPGIEALLNKCN